MTYLSCVGILFLSRPLSYTTVSEANHHRAAIAAFKAVIEPTFDPTFDRRLGNLAAKGQRLGTISKWGLQDV
jgi:hypothetical protein